MLETESAVQTHSKQASQSASTMASSTTDSKLRQIEGSLRQLCADAKRSHPVVKDAAERAIRRLRQHRPNGNSASGSSSGDSTFVQSEDFVRPFLLACNHRGAPKAMIVTAINAIKTMITINAVAASQPINIARVMRNKPPATRHLSVC